MDWAYLFEISLTGIASGGLYALAALAFVMVYKATRVVNIAIGEMLMAGAYLFFTFASMLALPIWLAIPAAVLGAGLLGAVIERTVRRGGTVVIPAFAVGRTQSLLWYLWRLRQDGRLNNTPVYLDSPMATSATELMRRWPDDHRLDPADYEAACVAVTCVRDVEESKALSANPYPKVIISASGMATGGRVLHHIAAFGRDHANTLLFSGYQASGTRGRALLAGRREVKMFGQWIPIAAEVTDLPMLSAHADSDELMRWLSGFRRRPERVFIVHGEPDASEALRVRIGRELGWNACVPREGQRFSL